MRVRRSARLKKPCEGDAKEGAEQPESDGEACAILQAVKRLAAALSGDIVATQESDDPKNWSDHVRCPFRIVFFRQSQKAKTPQEPRIRRSTDQSPRRA